MRIVNRKVGGGGGGMALSPISEGTLTPDGTDQMVVADVGPAVFSGVISLENMQAGDVVTIRYYGRVLAASPVRLYWEESYAGEQAQPLVHFSRRVFRYFRVNLQQTAGPYRQFDYVFYKEA